MKYIIPFIISLSLFGCQRDRVVPKAMNAHAGVGYLQSQQCALLACQWPDDYPGVDDEGAAYKEGQAAAEDADCIDDEEEQVEPEDDNETWF